MTNYLLLKKYACTTYPDFTCKFKDNVGTLHQNSAEYLSMNSTCWRFYRLRKST